MDKKIEIKEEDHLTDNIASQNERELLHEFVSVKTSMDTVLVDTDCDMTVKIEVKSETPFIKHPVQQIKTESATYSSNWELHEETEIQHQTLFSDFGSENAGEFLLEDPLMVDNKYNSDHEMYNKIEFKEEPWTLGTETSLICNNIKDGDFPSVKSSRLCPEKVASTIIDISPLLLTEVPVRETSFCSEMDHLKSECVKCQVPCDVLTARGYTNSGQYSKYDEADRYTRPLYFSQRTLSHMNKKPQKCSILEKSFSIRSALNPDVLIHESKKVLPCKVCDKSFSQLSTLKPHNLDQEGKKPHQCNVCDRSFTHLSNLKAHYLIMHVGKKLNLCKLCDKSFTHLSNLKSHNLVSEEKRSNKCKDYDSFSQSNLKTHLVYDSKKPHQCTVCNKSFSRLSTLKIHNLIHEGKKPHQCKICNKNFTYMSTLKTHNLIHDGKSFHKCKVCDRSFSQLSNLKRHNLIHEGKKPHQCKVCNKSFTDLSTLKTHNFVHEGKKPYQCKVCNKSFCRLSRLKTHSLIHEDNKT